MGLQPRPLLTPSPRVTEWRVGTKVLEPVLQSLKQLSGLLTAQDMDDRAGLIWLLGCSANATDADLDSFMSYGHGIGPEKVCSALLPSYLYLKM